jgi:class 3 adenylate cyclase
MPDDDSKNTSTNAGSGTMGKNRRGAGDLAAFRNSRGTGEGAEGLTTALNQILGGFIDVICQHNGDVVKFVGDGIIILWKATSDRTVDQCALYACVCSVAAMKFHMNLISDTNFSQLGLHIGVGHGAMTGYHVGGSMDRWEYFVFGQAAVEMNAGVELAKNTEIVICAETYRSLERNNKVASAAEFVNGLDVMTPLEDNR